MKWIMAEYSVKKEKLREAGKAVKKFVAALYPTCSRKPVFTELKKVG